MFSALACKCIILALLFEFTLENIHVDCKYCNRRVRHKNVFKSSHNCKVKDIPTISSKGVTVPPPNLLLPTWFVFRHNHRMYLGMNITWTQTENWVFNMTEGYVVFIQRDNFTWKFQVTFDLSMNINNHNMSGTQMVYFTLHCHDKHLMLPELTYYFSVMSLPAHHPHTDIQRSNLCEMNIPGCSNEDVATTVNCKHRRKNKKKYTDSRSPKKHSKTQASESIADLASSQRPSIYASLGIGIVISLIGLSACVLVIIKRRKFSLKNASFLKQSDGSLLLLINTEDEDQRHLEIGNLFASMFKGECEFNLWKRTEIVNPSEWVRDKVGKSHHVLFLCTPQGRLHHDKWLDEERSGHCNVFVSALQLYERDEKVPGATAVYFDKDRRCIPRSLESGTKCFKLFEEVDEFCDYLHKSARTVQFHQSADQFTSLKKIIEQIR